MNNFLEIEGYLNDEILNKLDLKNTNNSAWFFVDYSLFSPKLGEKFKFIKDKMEFNMELIDIMDQFCNKHSEIPIGWKTICEFNLSTANLPIISVIDLPIISTWKHGKNALIIYNF